MRFWPYARPAKSGLRRGSVERRLKLETLEGRLLLTGSAPTVEDVALGSTAWSSAFLSHVDPADKIGYHIPVGSASQSKPLPWINLDRLFIRFSEDVNVQANDLSLTGVNTPTLPVSHFFYDAVTFTATWTFTAPLGANFYHIDLNADGLGPVEDLDGNELDGDWVNNSAVYPSGNGTPGGDFEFTFKVVPGDSNQTGTVDMYDYMDANSRQGSTPTSPSYSKFADVDGSGLIDSQDVQNIHSRLMTTYPAGSPLGASNDAPTTIGGWSVAIDDPTIDVPISLFDAFEDSITSDSQLTYEVTSNTSASLFDSVTVNAITGQLVLNAASNASGRSRITVRATDAGGLSTSATFMVDVSYTNVAPSLNFWVEAVDDDLFEVFGVVTDDDIVEGLFVEFSGVLNLRATVRADGAFSFVVAVAEADWGEVQAIVADLQGLSSPIVERTVGVS